MDRKLAIYTISDPHYVGLAPTMFESAREHYPEADLYLFMIGTGTNKTLIDGVKVVYIGDVLDAKDLDQRLCYYLGVELACSVRPDCFKHLFDRGYSNIIYLDPDIYVFRRMAEADALLDKGANGIVTAHALKSISSTNIAVSGGDIVFLRVGIYNLGFIALNDTPETRRMLDWWQRKLKWHCLVDMRNGLFVDQKWLEFLPVFFEGFEVLKLPTYNLAPWNAEHYKITKRGGKFFADGQPVAFIHFSGIKRTHDHYKDMPKALNFYLEKISPWEHKSYGFIPYKPKTSRDGIVWDKIFTMLYQEYVRKTEDFTSHPMKSAKVYDYITGLDPATGIPMYLKKVIEAFPDYAVANLCRDDNITYDTMLTESRNPKSPYLGCIYPETIEKLLELSRPNEVAVTSPSNVGSLRRAVMKTARAIVRVARPALLKIRPARWAYAVTKRVVMRVFRLAVPRPVETANARIMSILLRQAKGAELVK